MIFDQNFSCISDLSNACYIPAHFIALDLIILIIIGKATGYEAYRYAVIHSPPPFSLS